MKPPVKAEKHLYEHGEFWVIEDAIGDRIASYIDESDAKLICELINADYKMWQSVMDADYSSHRCRSAGDINAIGARL